MEYLYFCEHTANHFLGLVFFSVLSFKNTVRRKSQLYGVTQSFRRLPSHILLIWFLCLRRQHVFLWVQTCDLKWHQQKTLELRFPLIVATFLPWHLLIFFNYYFYFSPSSRCDYQSAVKIWSKLMLYFVKLWHAWFFFFFCNYNLLSKMWCFCFNLSN